MAHLFIQWSDLNETGLSIIDEQHRAVVSLINSFHYHKFDPFIERILVPTAKMTLNLAKIHFLTEEELMTEAEYPGLDEHVLSHEKFYANLITVERECRATKDADGFLAFLKNWWLNHINGYDRMYAPYLKDYFGDRV